MPEDMPEEDLVRIIVRNDYSDLETGALDPTKREDRRRSKQEILDTLGIVILVAFFATIYGGESLLTEAEASVRGSEFPNSVILNVPQGGKTPITEMEPNVFLQGYMMKIIPFHVHWVAWLRNICPNSWWLGAKIPKALIAQSNLF